MVKRLKKLKKTEIGDRVKIYREIQKEERVVEKKLIQREMKRLREMKRKREEGRERKREPSVVGIGKFV